MSPRDLREKSEVSSRTMIFRVAPKRKYTFSLRCMRFRLVGHPCASMELVIDSDEKSSKREMEYYSGRSCTNKLQVSERSPREVRGFVADDDSETVTKRPRSGIFIYSVTSLARIIGIFPRVTQ